MTILKRIEEKLEDTNSKIEMGALWISLSIEEYQSILLIAKRAVEALGELGSYEEHIDGTVAFTMRAFSKQALSDIEKMVVR